MESDRERAIRKKIKQFNERRHARRKEPTAPAPGGINLLSAIGNRNMQQIGKGMELLMKLAAAAENTGSIHELEADRIAEAVVRASSTRPDKEQKADNAQKRKVYMATNTPGKKSAPYHRANLKLGKGKPLAPEERTYFEERMGGDFSCVRVYTGPTAEQFARVLKARAFTYKNNIVFGKGEYAPGTREGKKLMAHELAHVMQGGDGLYRKEAPNAAAHIDMQAAVIRRYRAFKQNSRGNIWDFLFSIYKSTTGGRYDRHAAMRTLTTLAGFMGMSTEQFKAAFKTGNFVRDPAAASARNFERRAKNIIDNFYRDSYTTTEGKIRALEADGYDVSLVRAQVARLRARLRGAGPRDDYAGVYTGTTRTIQGIHDNTDAPDKHVYNSEARDEAIAFMIEHQLAFEKGYQYGGTPTGNGSLVPKNNKSFNEGYYNVSRNLYQGTLSVNSVEEITRSQGDAIKANHTAGWEGDKTYCNIATSHVSEAYGAPNLEYFDNDEHTANQIYDNLNNGIYNTTTHKFAPVTWQQAEQYASQGGFALAVWKNPNKNRSGHIVTIIGGFDGPHLLKNLKIFQAGTYDSFGFNKLSHGFSKTKRKELQFYIWRKK